ncbi:hypothetical protein J1N10_17550 [Carboxylicivirga sp. A043]|uniref:hypothetical protein n=1 Tax=Carboxylicivirga litoralis TaxID=2816963 RepID=UPI0021CB9445|nr:hypothetical protein [Carboxylicivirga sp. A043]MCU4157785.1 hypothetical protein [Carboxylicivirga sp. A043]
MANLFVYNPTCDMAVENGTNSFMPSRFLSKFESDISPLMALLANEENYILNENPISESFIEFWKKNGIPLPTFIKTNELSNISADNIIPWGWSQVIVAKFAKQLNTDKQPPIFFEGNDYRNFFSRQTSLQLCVELCKRKLPAFVSIPTLPQTISSYSDVHTLFSHHPDGIVLKTLWSSSGRGLTFIRNNKQLQNAGNWINAQLKKHGSLIIEPIYNKVQDASLQFNITKSGDYEFLGLNYFDADQQGHFNKEYFHIPEQIIEQLPSNDAWINQTANFIIESMQTLKLHKNYFGPIGIDVMFIKSETGDIKFYPLVEANLRCNMGLINLHLKKRIAAKTSGTWQIDQFKEGEAPAFYDAQTTKHPLIIKNGKITKGFFPLTPFENNTRFAAWGIVY